jgi:pimeloyl-ACP methyl ester carboxylesterase
MPDDVTPYRVEIPDAVLADLRERLVRTRWPERETVPDWSQGIPLGYVQDLCRYWVDGYDWRATEARLNRLGQFKATVDGLGVHFLHVRSPEPEALPLVITHGWPGSVVEFEKVIGPLSDPAGHGGDRADAFHVVCPSLPGYGWSDKPSSPGWGVERIASAWHQLMTRLGYQRYGAQGGDWGAMVTMHMGRQAARESGAGGDLAGIHLNMPAIGAPRDMRDDLTPKEQAALEGIREFQEWETGYSREQSTKPQTLGYGLVDSPAAQCAWIVEKFRTWTDCDGDPGNVFTRDELLDNVMLYWLTASGASSARLYWESLNRRNADPVPVPTGCSIFPKEIFRPSRRWAERLFPDIRYWNELDRGGHFAAFEQPELFVGELRAFFRLVR